MHLSGADLGFADGGGANPRFVSLKQPGGLGGVPQRLKGSIAQSSLV